MSASEYFQIDYDEKPNYFLNGFLALDAHEVKAMQVAVDFLTPAHNIEFGMAHPEFILDQETGRLYMLEMNGRVGGGGVPAIDAQVYGISHLHLHLLALFDPTRFEKEFRNFPRPRKKMGFMFIVSSPGFGIWNPTAIRAIRSDPSYFLPGPQYEMIPESRVEPTVSMDTAQGMFYFVGDRAQVRRGVEKSMRMFEEGQLIDHTRIVDGGGSIAPQLCNAILLNVSANRSRLVESMKNAAAKIDWRKF